MRRAHEREPNEHPAADISPTNAGYVWVSGAEAHELLIGFATVHVRKRAGRTETRG